MFRRDSVPASPTAEEPDGLVDYRTRRVTAPYDPRDGLHKVVKEKLGKDTKGIILLGKDEHRLTYCITLQDDTEVIARVTAPNMPPFSIQSEVGTLRFIKSKTSIPVPEVLYFCSDESHTLGVHALLEKASGVQLQSAYEDVKAADLELIAQQIAKWCLEIFRLRFDKIGSLYQEGTEFRVGPILSSPFYTNHRGRLDLKRGPWSSARQYMLGCAERERDVCNAASAAGSLPQFKQKFEEEKAEVERNMDLLEKLINACPGLDDDDPEFAPLAMSTRMFDLSNIYVQHGTPSRILYVTDWHGVTIRPLWKAARLPRWLEPALSDSNQSREDKTRLLKIFKSTIEKEDGKDSLLLRALPPEDPSDRSSSFRLSLHNLCNLEATDRMLYPTLQTLAATLPGSEDFDGFQAILDPETLVGRVARISLVTQGSGAMSLATPHKMPSRSSTLTSLDALSAEERRPGAKSVGSTPSTDPKTPTKENRHMIWTPSRRAETPTPS